MMILTVSAYVTASDAKFKAYGEYMVSGKLSESNSSGANASTNLSMLLLGGQLVTDKLTLTGEITPSSQMNFDSIPIPADGSFMEMKAGIALYKDSKSRFDLTGSYLNIDWKFLGRDVFNHSGFVLGFDTTSLLSEVTTSDFSAGLGFGNSTKIGGVRVDDGIVTTLIPFKFKLNILISQNAAISLGYRGYCVLLGDKIYRSGYLIDLYSGLVAGVTVKL